MERRTRRRAFARNVYSAQKRLLAFLLAAAMILTNVGSDLSVAFAGTSESVVFELTGSELVRAVEEAIASGNEVTREDLDFTNGKVEQFEKLFFGEGKLYEAYPEFDGGGGINSELRIFVRLPEDADDMYMVTGDEEILFLYINNGDGTIRCSTNITRTVDGEEKVKKTKSVTIRSYESAFGDEEVNIIPDQPKQDVNEATSSTADKENTNSNNSNQTNENTTPAENQGAGDAAQDEIDKENAAAPDQNVTDGGNDAQAPQEDVVAPDGEAQTPDAGNQEENAPEADAADQAAEPEGDTAEPDAADEPEEAAEPEGDTAEPEEAAGPEDNAEPIASVIRHYAPVVADNENGEAAPADDSQKEQVADVPDSADQAEAPNEDAAVEEPKAEEPKVDEPAADAPAADNTVTTPDGNTADGAVTTPDENGTGDAAAIPDENGTGDNATTPNENGTGDVTAPQEPTDETPAPTPDTPVAGEDQNNGQPAGTPDVDQPQAPEEELPKESVVTVIPPATPSEGTEQKPEEQKPEDNVSAATTSDLVGMGYCSTAKAYSVTLNQLKALDDFEGYKVTYDIAPKASARIVDGPRGVEEGGTLVFGVKNQIGYAIEAVAVNGEVLEADSVTDNDDGSQTAWYTVEEVYEEQEVVVTMTESGEHPEFSATLPMSDGTIIHLYAEEGVLPAGVKAEASVVTGIEDVVKANVEAEAEAAGEQKEVVASLSYNIDLLDKDGHKLDDQIWSGSVQVTFTGVPVEKHSKEADVIEVMYVETTKEDEAQANVTAEDVIALEAVSEPIEVAGEESVASVMFDAEHFSTYTVIFTNNKNKTRSVEIYAILEDGTRLETERRNYNFSNSDAISVDKIASEVITGIPAEYRLAKVTLDDSKGTEIKWLRYTTGNYGSLQYNAYDQKYSWTWEAVPQNVGINFIYTDGKVQVKFDLNGFSGAEIKPIQGYEDAIITLPDGEGIERPGYVLLGWSDEADSSAVRTAANGGYVGYYPLGSSYQIPSGGSTLYAAWAQTSGNKSGKITIAIRKDGTVPDEPSIQNADYKYLVEGMSVNLLDYINPAHTVAGPEKVKEVLQPKFYDFVDNWNSLNRYWNTTTQYVEWYVVKDQRNDNTWHIDGVIRQYKNVYLDYDRNNAPVGAAYGLAPDGVQYNKGATAIVSDQHTLKWPGHDFLGWNTQKDGRGVWYYPGDQIVMNDNVTLYAQWGEKNSIVIYYKPVGEGTVTNDQERLNPEIGEAEGATAVANIGYKFVGWYSDKDCLNLLDKSPEFKPDRPDSGWVDRTVFYAKFEIDTDQKFDYKVNFYIKGSTTPVPGLTALEGEAPVGEFKWTNVAKTETGYKLVISPVQPTSMIITAAGPNVKNVFYEIDETQKFEYKVNFYINGTTTPVPGLAALEGEAPVGEFSWTNEAKTATGYKLVTSPVQPTSMIITAAGPNVKNVYYEVDETQKFDYKVEFVKMVNGNKEDLEPSITETFNVEADVTASPRNIPGYTLVGFGTNPENYGNFVDNKFNAKMPGENLTVTYIYEENENIAISYQSESLTKGTVTLDTESIAPATGAPKGSEAKPADGYVFTHWTNSNGDTVATGEDNKHYTPVKNAATEVFEADTYTAHFTERGDLSYKVEYYFDGKLGETVTQDNVKFGTDIAYTTTNKTYNNLNYVFEKTEGPKTVGADSEQNLLRVYYTLDSTGTEKPGTPDGVPDKFQITIRYEANANGSVGGTTVEVHTIQDFERDAVTGEIITVGPVKPATPNANVTTSANSRYTFDYWSIRGNADKKYNTTDDLTKQAFIEDVTFAANFRYVGGGNSGGGGGNNGGGGGSPSYKPDNDNGPGATVTINPDDVPMAIMPDTTPADLTVIDDGEVPFAALPKTGQGAVKGTLTMMMSGILLAIAAINKKRKEEDNS
ncbi:doubled motif LPXTG anchor domain-containing protein [Enterocloster sp.]|nr:doubled motif LPXTG anchor domain-containing protein [Enterocloster sp.]MDR3755861.1 doubled motif LPXTG anchor domain-containing protein [Enterocloster sp.]